MGLGVPMSKQEGTEWLRKAMDHACLNGRQAEKRSVDPI
jgi:hypothetical protein